MLVNIFVATYVASFCVATLLLATGLRYYILAMCVTLLISTWKIYCLPWRAYALRIANISGKLCFIYIYNGMFDNCTCFVAYTIRFTIYSLMPTILRRCIQAGCYFPLNITTEITTNVNRNTVRFLFSGMQIPNGIPE